MPGEHLRLVEPAKRVGRGPVRQCAPAVVLVALRCQMNAGLFAPQIWVRVLAERVSGEHDDRVAGDLSHTFPSSVHAGVAAPYETT
jgi:hypothetical protein